MEEQMNCFYLDSSFQSASNMLKKCVQNQNSPYQFNCGDNPMKQETQYDLKETARMNDIMIQRGVIDFRVSEYDTPNVIPDKKFIKEIEQLKKEYLKIKIKIFNEIIDEIKNDK